MKTRNINVDILKAMAAFFVVILHARTFSGMDRL